MTRLLSRDHPRSRGVYTEEFRGAVELAGSSPLARGLLLVFLLVICRSRIIPARAGFTSRPPLSAV